MLLNQNSVLQRLLLKDSNVRNVQDCEALNKIAVSCADASFVEELFSLFFRRILSKYLFLETAGLS